VVFLTILFIENFPLKLKFQIIRYCTRTEVVGGEWIVLNNEAGGCHGMFCGFRTSHASKLRLMTQVLYHWGAKYATQKLHTV
jgi:hypothetical protein